MKFEPTPNALTTLLRESGVLEQGNVLSVEERQNNAFNSALTHLALTYDVDMPGNAPRQLVLKCNIDADWARRAGRREVEFYRLMGERPTPLQMLIPCYGAAYDVGSGDSFLLLPDIAVTHAPPITRDEQIALQGVPPDQRLMPMVEALAHFHAYWWEHPLLGEDPAAQIDPPMVNEQEYRQFIQRFVDGWDALIAEEKVWFPEELRAIYQHAADRLPDVYERLFATRFETRAQLTLTHGDSYFANFLCPKNEGAGATYLIDWQSPWVGWSAVDLMPFGVAFWTREQRQDQQRELRVLRRYHDTLLRAGVAEYTWEELLHDYRLALLYWLFVPVQDRADGSSQSYWLPKLQCLAAAYEDWNCADLL